MRSAYPAMLSVALVACAQGGGTDTSNDRVPPDARPLADSGTPPDAPMDAPDQGVETGGDAGPPCTLDAECDDGIACTVDRCDPADGCVNLADDTSCDDGLVCNGLETCDGTGSTLGDGCAAGTSVDCDDGDPCTTDLCAEPSGTCSHAGSDADMDGHAAMGCGSGMDCDDTDGMVFPGATETCNAVDDDCDGTVDDGFTCVMGMAASCTTSCGTGGMVTCDASCGGFGACVGTEVCNGCDDDGAGGADDTFTCVQNATTPCTTSCGTPGTHTCNGSCTAYGACTGMEVCDNGCDDDGDGMTDEGCSVPPPANDTCGGAIVLSGSSGTRSDAFDGATATASGCGAGGEIWYAITLGSPRVLYADTFGSAFDTRLSLRSSCGGAMAVCEDDHCGTGQEQLATALPAGTHYLAVHAAAAGSASGMVSLRWQTLATSGGDNLRVPGNGDYGGSTTSSANGHDATCAGGSGGDDMLFFTLCPATSRTVTASTCAGTSFDTVLSIVGASGELACDDDTCGVQSTTSASVTGPGVFGVVIDGYGLFDDGSYSLNISGL